MKKILLLAVVLCSWMTIGAQGLQTKSKMSPWLRSQYNQQQAAVKKNGGPLRVNGRPVRKYILTLVQSSDDATTIRQKGGVVWQDFGDGICAAFLPMDSLGVLDQCPSILCMEANPAPKLMNDTSAVIIGVDKVLNSQFTIDNSQLAFTGKGVIAGVMDVSFDFTHPAFRNEDGTSRIQWFWDPTAENDDPDALGIMYNSPERVLAAQCSSDAILEEPHGTHVLGSMAGGGLNGYYVGMAPDADIMGAHILLGSVPPDVEERFGNYVKNHLEDWEGVEDAIAILSLSSVQELVELKKLFDAADAAGKPCVVNWSFGAAFDFGSDYTLYEEVLNHMLGPGHILMVAAGNSGHKKTFVRKEAKEPINQDLFFDGSEESTKHEYVLSIRVDNGFDPYFKMELDVEDVSEPLLIDTHEILNTLTENGEQYYTILKEEIAANVSHLIYPGGMHGFEITLLFNPEVYTHPEKLTGTFRIDTPIALDFNAYVGPDDKLTFSPYSYEDSRGCNQHTIGYPASLERVITVGAMHHRSSFTNYHGESSFYKKMGSEEGHLVSFSSCGPTLDGRVKPDVVAPGHNIISALSSFYKKNGSEEETKEEVDNLIATKANVFGKEYGMWALSGTSMATPITAGIIALWLQAKPDLTPEDIKGVIERTSHQPEPEFSGTDKNVYYGWGEIDAYKGLLYILGISTAIPELSQHQPKGVKFRLQGNTLYIDGLEDSMVNDQWSMVNVYDLRGRIVASAPLAGGSVSLPADSPAGVYAVQVGKIGSTLIRL